MVVEEMDGCVVSSVKSIECGVREQGEFCTGYCVNVFVLYKRLHRSSRIIEI